MVAFEIGGLTDMAVKKICTYFQQSGANTGETLRTGIGFLHTVTWEVEATAVISLYDAVSATNPIFVMTAVESGNAVLDVVFNTGLFIVTTVVGSQWTVSFA